MILTWIIFQFLLLNQTVFSQVQDFCKSHYDFLRTWTPGGIHNYCNVMMLCRGMTSRGCTPNNTFIHTSAKRVNDICNAMPTKCSDPARISCYSSLKTFKVTECLIVLENAAHNCLYRSIISFRRIRVCCAQKQPVTWIRQPHCQTLLRAAKG